MQIGDVRRNFLDRDSVSCEETVSPLSRSEAARRRLLNFSAETSWQIQNIPLETVA